MSFAASLKRILAWPPRDWEKGQTAKAQDRLLARQGLEEGCVFCQAGPWAWAYPMRRSIATPDGGDMLFPPHVPVCGSCHGDLINGNNDALNDKLSASKTGRHERRMREMLPLFLAARDGDPAPRVEAPDLDREVRKGR